MPEIFLKTNAVGGAPFGNERTNAEGSPYLTESPTAMGAFSTSDLERVIFDTIFNTKDETAYDALKLMVFSKTPVSVDDDVFTWKENGMQRVAILIDDGASSAGAVLTAAQAGTAGGYKTATMPVTAAQMGRIGINQTLMFSATLQATVFAKNTTDITIKSLVSEGLPAIIQGARIPMMGETVGDNSVGLKNVERTDKVERHNYVGTFRRGIQYGRKEKAKLRLNSRNNHVEIEHRNVIDEIKFDSLQNLFYGRKGTRLLDDGNYAKGMDGLYAQMKAGGSTFATTSPENLIATFEQNAVSTNQQSAGGSRTIYAPSKWLLQFSQAYKESRTRFSPTDTMVNVDLERIHIAGQNYNLCAVDILADPNYFSPDCANRAFVVDEGSVTPVKWSAFPMFDLNRMVAGNADTNYEDLSRAVQENIQRQDFSTRDAELCFSLMVVAPRRSFGIEIA